MPINSSMTDHGADSPVRLVVAGMLALVVAMGIGRFVYTPILPMMTTELSLSASQAGMIASSNFLGYLIGALLATSKVFQNAKRFWMLSALTMSALTTLFMWLANSYGQFLILRFLGGLVSAWVLVFTSAMVIEHLVRSGRQSLNAVLFAGVGIGIVCSSILTLLAALYGDGWRSAWLYSGVFSFMGVLIVLYLVPSRAENKQTKDSLKSADIQMIMPLIAAYGLFGFGYIITATFIAQLVRSAHYTLSVETWVWVLVGLSAAPSVWLWNKLSRHLGNRKTLALALVVEAIAVALSVLYQTITGFVLSAIFLGGTFMAITALGLVEARRQSGGDPSYPLALMTAAFGLGQIVGPLTAGYLKDMTGSFLWPSLAASIALLAAAILVVTNVQGATIAQDDI